jgi:hypothetical protein
VPDNSQFENLKTAGEKIDDIFDHTDAKVVEVMEKITKLYNKKRSSTLDLDSDEDLLNALRNNIAFHSMY